MGVDLETFDKHPAIGVAAMAFCYPGTAVGGGDHPPPARCAALWRASLLAALPSVELTLLVGRSAHLWALGAGAKKSMDAAVRAWRESLPGMLMLPHPSWRNSHWLNANPWFEAEVTPWLCRRVAQILAA